MFDNIIAGIISTVIGGAVLAVFFFFAREHFFGIADITGKWYFEMKTVNTAYNPYKGMILRYVAIIWREGNSISGSVEKVYENSSTGEREYIGENRSRGYIKGAFEKNYFKKDRIFIHVNEKGKGRESTNCFELVVKNKKKLSGNFHSFVADQDGSSKWQRSSF